MMNEEEEASNHQKGRKFVQAYAKLVGWNDCSDKFCFHVWSKLSEEQQRLICCLDEEDHVDHIHEMLRIVNKGS